MKENVFNKIKGINEFIYKYNIHIIVLGILILFFVLSISNQKYNIILTIILLIWIYNILYSIINLKKRFLYLIMNLMLFTFVLSRPTLNLIRGNSVWYFSDIVIQKTLLSIGIAEIFLAIGNYIAEGKLIIKIQEYVKRIFSFRQDKRAPKIENENYYINNVLIVLLVISGTANIFMSILNYINMKNQDYALIYTSGVQKFPFVLRNIAAIFPFSITAFLSTMPNKKKTTITLIAYCISNIPLFLLGNRSGLVLSILFSIVYIIIRYFIEKKDTKWITKRKVITVLIMIPIFIVLLGAYNYIREDKEVKTKSPISLIADFFYKQGTTFDTICQGFKYESKLKNDYNIISYSLGDILDYLMHSTISQKMFNTDSLGTGNNMNMIKESNSMAHHLSYLVLGEETYLKGHGRGTSYIIETYMDGGYFLLAIYSLILGYYLTNIIGIIEKQDKLVNYIILTTLLEIFLLPRYSASGFFSFIVEPQFWVIPIIIISIKYIIRLRKGKVSE